ncbi:RNA-guided endonuclease IscB [Nonomuraea sp. NPDC049784]|uniref:RNA-guided endonuclease IscB n=1 Tax=Nonomuraea sp. NPDC049784 TaxID=3154361 RepID=UPI0033C61AC6
MHPFVFVLDKQGHPLQPCTPARARKLLAAGRAVVARHTPFVIRLKDRTVEASQVDGVQVGVDPGSKHTGIAVFTERAGERQGRFAIQLDHRGATIRKKVQQRAAYRRGRRSRNLRYRAPRFYNRRRPDGWLAPSLRHRVETTVSWIGRLSRWAPVRAVHVERTAFDTHAMSADRPLVGVEYQHGTLQRTRTDRFGFPRLRLPRVKQVHGFATGDLVSASVPSGKNAGVHTGRAAVRTSGKFNITTAHGTVQGIHHRHVRLLQRGEGYAYHHQGETDALL